jgi:hypothetical protein
MQHLTTQILIVPGQIIVLCDLLKNLFCKNLFCNCTTKYQSEVGTLSGYHKIVVHCTMRAKLGSELHSKLLVLLLIKCQLLQSIKRMYWYYYYY